jgi:hypothetical protein
MRARDAMLLGWLLTAAAACTATATSVPARGAIDRGPPPPPGAEAPRPPAPSPAAAWSPGAWRWNGVQYTWQSGRWDTPPPAPRYGDDGVTSVK